MQLFSAFLGSMFPEEFQDSLPSAFVMIFIWSAPICQAAAAFVAIRYIQRNPDKQKPGVICLIAALVFFTANSFLSMMLTGLANWDTSHFGWFAAERRGCAMNRNYSMICYIVSYILSMTCMPAMVTACHHFKCDCHCAAGEKTGSSWAAYFSGVRRIM